MKSLLSILIICLCIGAYFLYIKPLSIDVRVLSSKKDEYSGILNKVKDIKEKRDQLLSQYDSISPEDVDRLNKILPENIDSVVLVNNLNNVGSKYGVVIKDYRVVEPNTSSRDEGVVEPNKIYKTTKVTLTVAGQYNQFISFIKEVDSVMTLLDITSLIIRPAASKAVATNVMDYVLEANIYSLR